MNESLDQYDAAVEKLVSELKSLQHENRVLDQQARRARLALIRLVGIHSTEKQLEIIDEGLGGDGQ